MTKVMKPGQAREHHFDQERFSLEASLGRKLVQNTDSRYSNGGRSYLIYFYGHLTDLAPDQALELLSQGSSSAMMSDSTINRGLVDYLSASRPHLTQLDFEKLRRAVQETAFTIIPFFPEFAFDSPQDLTINSATHTRDRLDRLWATRAK